MTSRITKTIISLSLLSLTMQSTIGQVWIKGFIGESVESVIKSEFIGEGVTISNASFNHEKTFGVEMGYQFAKYTSDEESECDMLSIKEGLLLVTNNAASVIGNNLAFSHKIPDDIAAELQKHSTDFEFFNYYANGYLAKKEFDKYKVYETTYQHAYEIYINDKNADLHDNPELTTEECDNLYNYMSSYGEENLLMYYIAKTDLPATYDPTKAKLFPLYRIYKLFAIDISTNHPGYTETQIDQLNETLDNDYFFYHEQAYSLVPELTLDYSDYKYSYLFPYYEQITKEQMATESSSELTDEELNNLFNLISKSPAILEFDFETGSDSISFDYAFASQEYPEYVGSNFNDAFAFFVTDLTTNIKKNIALIPGSSDYVSINNINENTNSQYFIPNYYPDIENSPCNINFGGFTKTLTANMKVVPCRKYHIKIVVANSFDKLYQSGVFLKAKSFTANSISCKTTINKAYAKGISLGCSEGEVLINIKDSEKPTTVTLSHLGTAKNGIDYKKMPTSITIPSHQTSFILNVSPIREIEEDSLEIKIALTLQNSCSDMNSTDTASIMLYNNPGISLSAEDITDCCPSKLSIGHTGLIGDIQWSPSDFLQNNNDTLVNVTSCIEKKTKFTVKAYDISGCNEEDISFFVIPCKENIYRSNYSQDINGVGLIHNCNNGMIKFSTSATEPLDISLTYEGEATKYIDLESLPSTISLSQTGYVLPINPIEADVKETDPVLRIIQTCSNCQSDIKIDTTIITFQKTEKLSLEDDKTISSCDIKDSISIGILSGGNGKTVWSPNDFLGATDQPTVSIDKKKITKDITYIVTITDSIGCSSSSSKITVTECIEPYFSCSISEDRNDRNRLTMGCNHATLAFMAHNAEEHLSINLKYEGDAIMGTDFNTLPNSITLDKNGDPSFIDITSINTNLSEEKHITLIQECKDCGETTKTDTLTLLLSPQNKPKIQKQDTLSACELTSLSVELTSGKADKIEWSPKSYFEKDGDLIAILKNKVTETTDFHVVVSDSLGCFSDSTTITVKKEFCGDIHFSNEISSETDDYNDFIYNCNNGRIIYTVERTNNTEPVSIELRYEGAINGIDFQKIPDVITIGRNDSSYTLNIIPTKTGNVDTVKTLIITQYCPLCDKSRGETITSTINIREIAPIVFEPDKTFSSCDIKDSIGINLLSGNPGIISWSPADFLEETNKLNVLVNERIDKGIQYTITATDSFNCFHSTAKMSIRKDYCLDIIIPNSFNPEDEAGDNKWKIYGIEELSKSEVKIYNRFGKLIFTFNHLSEGWDGTYKGKACPSEDYWYELNAPEIDKIYTGHFTLIRR